MLEITRTEGIVFQKKVNKPIHMTSKDFSSKQEQKNWTAKHFGRSRDFLANWPFLVWMELAISMVNRIC